MDPPIDPTWATTAAQIDPTLASSGSRSRSMGESRSRFHHTRAAEALASDRICTRPIVHGILNQAREACVLRK